MTFVIIPPENLKLSQYRTTLPSFNVCVCVWVCVSVCLLLTRRQSSETEVLKQNPIIRGQVSKQRSLTAGLYNTDWITQVAENKKQNRSHRDINLKNAVRNGGAHISIW